jgi:hypothetical protein
MKARDYSGLLWVSLINRFPKFWNSIRPNTLAVKSRAGEIEKSIQKLRALYPGLKKAKMYFTIGGLRSGGTTMDDMVLIGTEIATGNASTDVSEFPDKWLAGVFKEQRTDNIVPLNIHEYIHTQQRGESQDLLGQSIREGACDFITELVMGSPLQNSYLIYGRAHEAELKEKFKEEMFTSFYGNWLYNGASAVTVADLGYFMGYVICKTYYQHALNKKQAVKEIIELPYADSGAVESFLKRSGYFTELINRHDLISSFENKRPYVVQLSPFSNGDSLVDASIKELTILFSSPMNPKRYSINISGKGRDYFPVSGVVGFSDNGTSFTLKLDLKPGHAYEFMITDKSFKSAEGYPLKPYEVRFRTRE